MWFAMEFGNLSEASSLSTSRVLLSLTRPLAACAARFVLDPVQALRSGENISQEFRTRHYYLRIIFFAETSARTGEDRVLLWRDG